VVPQRAAHYPLLLYAIFALAALHRSRTLKDINQEASYHEASEYHDLCLQIMIPVLDDAHSAFDVNFLASVIVLRSYEEMSGESSWLQMKYFTDGVGQAMKTNATFWVLHVWSTR
jgi:Fungal specific transcription factor domain